MLVVTPWPDYVSAFGAIVGILVAVIGVVIARAASKIARKSAADSKLSAEAARKTAKAADAISEASTKALQAATAHLEVATREHEQLEADRARRPVVDRIELSEVEPSEGEEPSRGVFRIAFRNTGNRDLNDAFLTILFVRGCAAELLADRWGAPRPTESKDSTSERWPGVHGPLRDLDYFVVRVTGECDIAKLLYVRIPRHGTFPLRAKLSNADLAGGGPWVDVRITVDEDGRTAITRIPSNDPTVAYEGRCIDFNSD